VDVSINGLGPFPRGIGVTKGTPYYRGGAEKKDDKMDNEKKKMRAEQKGHINQGLMELPKKYI